MSLLKWSLVCMSSPLFFFSAVSRVNLKCYLAPASRFVPSFLKRVGIDVIPSPSFSLSDKDVERQWKKEQVKKFLFQLCFVHTHKSRRFPQSFFSFFFHSTYLFILVFSHSSCHIKVKRVFGLLSEYQMLVGFKMHHKHKSHVCEFVANSFFFFFAIETNPWQAEEKRRQLMLHSLYHLSSSVKVKVKTKVFLST